MIKKFNTGPYVKFLREVEGTKIEKLYTRLKDKLSLGIQRMDYESLVEAIDKAARDFVDAGDLALIAENEFEKYELYYDMKMSKLMLDAQEQLEEQKKDGKLKSQITLDLKKSFVIKCFPEEYKKLETDKRKLKIIKKRMESLREAWKQRMSLIQSQARSLGDKRPVHLSE